MQKHVMPSYRILLSFFTGGRNGYCACGTGSRYGGGTKPRVGNRSIGGAWRPSGELWLSDNSTFGLGIPSSCPIHGMKQYNYISSAFVTCVADNFIFKQ